VFCAILNSGLPFSGLPFSRLAFLVCPFHVCHFPPCVLFRSARFRSAIFSRPMRTSTQALTRGVADVSGKGGNYPVTARPITASDELLSRITREQNTRPLHRAASVCTAQSCPWVHFVWPNPTQPMGQPNPWTTLALLRENIVVIVDVNFILFSGKMHNNSYAK